MGIQWRKGNHIKLWADPWLKSGTPLRSMFLGPPPQFHDTFTVSNVLTRQRWNWANFQFEITTGINKAINKKYLSIYTLLSTYKQVTIHCANHVQGAN